MQNSKKVKIAKPIIFQKKIRILAPARVGWGLGGCPRGFSYYLFMLDLEEEVLWADSWRKSETGREFLRVGVGR